MDRRIGALIRDRRESFRKTQTELAAALGVTFQQVQKYEKGQNQLSITRLLQMAEALGTTPDYFLQGDHGRTVQVLEEPQQASYDTLGARPPKSPSLLGLCREVEDPATRRALLRIAEVLADSAASRRRKPPEGL